MRGGRGGEVKKCGEKQRQRYRKRKTERTKRGDRGIGRRGGVEEEEKVLKYTAGNEGK